MNIKYINKRLLYLNINPSILEFYDEPHRFYHNIDHIMNMLDEAHKLEWLDDDEVFLSVVFHDIIHHPLSKNNEIKSVEFFRKICKNIIDETSIENISQAILDTIDHIPRSKLSEKLIKLDLINFEKDYKTMLKNHKLVMKEYLQFYSLQDFKKGNLKLLNKFKKDGYNVDFLIKYMEKL